MMVARGMLQALGLRLLDKMVNPLALVVQRYPILLKSKWLI